MILEVGNVSRRFGGLHALRDVSMTVPPGSVTGLIGPNGAGKSTLLDVVSGFTAPDSGVLRFRGRDITRTGPAGRARLGLARTFQDVGVFPTLTVLENVMLGVGRHRGETLWRVLLTPHTLRAEHRDLAQTAMAVLRRVGVVDDRPDQLAGELSYGQQKLVAIARMIASRPALALLDEPGSGLPLTMVAALGGLIRSMADEGTAVVIVDHNMQLVLELAGHVVVMNDGRVLAEGTPTAIRADPEVLRVYLRSEAKS
jgi:ABC-type branched-subunit amino acid transport system ATPase component